MIVSISPFVLSFPSLFPVKNRMLRACHQLQVLYAVVCCYAIDVMHNLTGHQRAAKVLFHDETMLKDVAVAIWTSDFNVALAEGARAAIVSRSSSTPVRLRIGSATVRAVYPGTASQFVGVAMKRLSANRTGAIVLMLAIRVRAIAGTIFPLASYNLGWREVEGFSAGKTGTVICGNLSGHRSYSFGVPPPSCSNSEGAFVCQCINYRMGKLQTQANFLERQRQEDRREGEARR